MNGMQRIQFDDARLDLLSLVIGSRLFWPSVNWNLREGQRWSKSVLTFDRCRPDTVILSYYYTSNINMSDQEKTYFEIVLFDNAGHLR